MSPRWEPMTWQERLYSHCVVQQDGCWRWTGALDRRSYGLWTGPEGHLPSRMTVATRWSYYARHGSIPFHLELDHLCNYPPCINPDHLEPVTRQENMRRRSERQTHCIRGHERNAENTYQNPSGSKRCRVCNREEVARKRASQRKQAAA